MVSYNALESKKGWAHQEMGWDGSPGVEASFVCVDEKNNADVKNKEVLKNIEALFPVDTSQENHDGCQHDYYWR